MPDRFIPPHGGYEKLLSFQKARIVYDGTVWFCSHFLNKRDRTFDQMVQAARSGKQNIVEGSAASETSKETEIKLTNVARASLEELLEDYRVFFACVVWENGQRKAGLPQDCGSLIDSPMSATKLLGRALRTATRRFRPT